MVVLDDGSGLFAPSAQKTGLLLRRSRQPYLLDDAADKSKMASIPRQNQRSVAVAVGCLMPSSSMLAVCGGSLGKTERVQSDDRP